MPERPIGLDVWEVVIVLMTTLCTLSCLFVMAGALLQGQPIGEALGIALLYALVVAVAGFVPLMIYAFFYSFYLFRRRIGYAGAACLGAAASLLFDGVMALARGSALPLPGLPNLTAPLMPFRRRCWATSCSPACGPRRGSRPINPPALPNPRTSPHRGCSSPGIG